MSMDLSVWSDFKIDLSSSLPNQSAWVTYDSEYAYEQDTWQVLVMPGEDDQAEASVLSKLPGAKYAYYISLEQMRMVINFLNK